MLMSKSIHVVITFRGEYSSRKTYIFPNATVLWSKPYPNFSVFIPYFLDWIFKTLMATALCDDKGHILYVFQDRNCYFSSLFLHFHFFNLFFSHHLKIFLKGKIFFLNIYHRKMEEYSPLITFCSADGWLSWCFPLVNQDTPAASSLVFKVPHHVNGESDRNRTRVLRHQSTGKESFHVTFSDVFVSVVICGDCWHFELIMTDLILSMVTGVLASCWNTYNYWR